MKLFVNREKKIIIEHNGREIDFQEFKRPNSWKFEPEDLFVELNQYWGQLPESRQDEIFAVYGQIFDLFMELDGRDLMRVLQTKLALLIDQLHRYDDLKAFLGTLDISIPDNATVEFDANEGRKHRALTYIRSEYESLIVATIQLRTVFPVWNIFNIAQSGEDGESKVYNILDTLRTLRLTKFISDPPMERLMEYVKMAYDHQPERNHELSSVIAGISSTEIPNYLFGSVIANRLITTPVDDRGGKTTLISSVFMRVKQDTQQLSQKFKQRVIGRSETRMGDSEDDKIGYLESYSVRQDVSDDIYLVNQVFLQDYRKSRRHLDDTIPSALVKGCIESLEHFPPKPIRKEQMTLVQWVLSSIVQPRAVPHINRESMLNAMGLTQAALIHWGFPEIATIISMHPMDIDNDAVSSNLVQFLPMDKDMKDQLTRVYPHARPQRDKSPVNLIAGYLAIESFATLFDDSRWSVQADDDVLRKLRVPLGEVRPNIRLKNYLAELLVMLNRNYKTADRI